MDIVDIIGDFLAEEIPGVTIVDGMDPDGGAYQYPGPFLAYEGQVFATIDIYGHQELCVDPFALLIDDTPGVSVDLSHPDSIPVLTAAVRAMVARAPDIIAKYDFCGAWFDHDRYADSYKEVRMLESESYYWDQWEDFREAQLGELESELNEWEDYWRGGTSSVSGGDDR